MVLEHVPAAAATRALEPLRRRSAAHPEDLANALALARGYLELGRANADPRFVSYAQATLAPWLQGPHPPQQALVLGAIALQNLHRFEAALELLDRALLLQPLDGQAWLTRATVLQVTGRLPEARMACRHLIRASGQLIALTCLASVDSLTGRLAQSYAALRSVFSDDARLAGDVRAFILGQLADMAVRLHEFAQAESYFRSALRAAPEDVYIKADYADLLLLQGREREVVDLLRTNELQDNLLLRLAIAGTRLQLRDGQRWSEMFQARYQAARADGDFTHLREQARYLLEVRHDAATALQLARENWSVQREPADLHVYLDAATAAGNPSAAEPVHQWMHQIGYEDRTLPPFLAQAAR
jgi:tetratricopeptide (TPR) repeat protein